MLNFNTKITHRKLHFLFTNNQEGVFIHPNYKSQLLENAEIPIDASKIQSKKDTTGSDTLFFKVEKCSLCYYSLEKNIFMFNVKVSIKIKFKTVRVIVTIHWT